MSETRKNAWPDGPPYVDPVQIDLSRPHLVGAMGELMTPLTQLLTLAGRTCTITDQRMRDHLAEAFRQTALAITDGQYRTSCVVYSSAIPDDHPDLVLARATGVPVVHRAQALDLLMNGQAGAFQHVRASIGVTGSHGKTSTAAMIGWILRQTDARPVVLLGGRWADSSTAIHADYGDTAVAELDESDRSHLLTHPDIAVIPALGYDHPETYADAADVHATMLRWACGLPHDATVILCADDPGAAALAQALRSLPLGHRVITYGTTPGSDVPLTAVSSGGAATGIVCLPGFDPVHVVMPGAGVHQVRNAAAAIIAAGLRGIDPSRAARALTEFPGVQRRFTLTGTRRDVTVIDSYAAHPTEIHADLAAARSLAGDGRVLLAFQPSGLERLVAFGPQIAQALTDGADLTLLLPLHTRYPDPTPQRAEHAHDQLAAHLLKADHALIPSCDDPGLDATALAAIARPGDVILTMGQGNVTDLGPRIIRALTAREFTRLALKPGRTQPRRPSRRTRRKS